mgnify:CR=1 FL=1|jgi:uncharacterized phage protein (TIGR01671 family)
MKPRFRAWMKQFKKMDNDIGEMHFEDGEFKYIGDDVRYKRLPEDIILMQSTGLFDKNGKEIFEGDIVSIDTDEFGLLVVKYETGIYWLTEDEQCVEHLSDYYKYVSVIGNIYENPELLEEEEKE